MNKCFIIVEYGKEGLKVMAAFTDEHVAQNYRRMVGGDDTLETTLDAPFGAFAGEEVA